MMDGSYQEAVFTGMGLVTVGAGSWSLVPVLVVIFAIVVLILLAKNVMRPDMSVNVEMVLFPIMMFVLIVCMGSMDSVLAWTDPPEGFMSGDMPSWVPSLFDGDIDHVLVACEQGRYIGPMGVLVAWVGSILYGFALRRTL